MRLLLVLSGTASLLGLASVSVAAAPPLLVLGENHPRAFFFRGSEGPPAQPRTTYEAWSADFGRLMGIMGKCLDEEVLGREARNPEFFSRFKREHPEQVVLLHFNGNARDPRYHTERYFAGHWIYREATRILADIPAESGETTIRVENTADFRVSTGRYHTSNDDLALFGITADGRHDWNHCEQVQLVAVDARAGTIRVRRGCYGSKPLAFRAGAARAAAHAVEGPWGRNNHLMWYYNLSVHCPRDSAGKSCADRLVDDLAAWFGPGGKLAAFDGLEFDVSFNETRGDTDGDGRLDHGVVGGRNGYGIGVIEFYRQLRARLGDGRILQADGALGPGGRRSQRAFGLINGIESEGFPNLNDWDFADWSGGLNRHAFWQANARAPAFHYINHKWNEAVPGQPGEHRNPDVPFSRHRLSFAAAVFTDAAICYSFAPPRETGSRLGIWDELRAGTDHRLGWLGRAEGPAVHLAAGTPDLLGGRGRPGAEDLVPLVQGPVLTQATASGLELRPRSAAADRLAFTLAGLPARGRDLVVLLTLQGAPRRGVPEEMARFVEVELAGGAVNLLRGEFDDAGIGLRGRPEVPLDEESGARLQLAPRTTLGGRALASVSVHPPYKAAKGYVYWCRDVEVPEGAELRFSLGMSDKAPIRSDGVWFKVLAAELRDNSPGSFLPLFERSTKANAWVPCTVSLARLAGKRVRLKFVADCGPNDNATTDQGFWGEVRLMRAGQSEAAVTPTQAAMTWLNSRAFTSAFHFRDVSSPRVDLVVTIDGGEPVTLAGLTVHAAPDAMYRVFEHGLVIANPSRQPYTFDLAALSPGRSYRRLPGSPTQDRAANSGEPVGQRITLGERDALFLQRTPPRP
ncbi:MAG: hypothetical protein HZC55_10140 [Verrucomicrobia bacterium]|nr:hypothetical protein [Verrucomicrobiota bacterium]